MNKLFETWIYKGVRFIAFPNIHVAGSVSVFDEEKNNYGAWNTVYEFRRRQKYGSIPTGLGKAELRFVVTALIN